MKSKKGFLLLEVIVSIVVITGGLVYVTRVWSASSRAIARSEEFFNSSLLAEAKMFEFEEKAQIEALLKSGEFSEGQDYTWEIEAAPMEGSTLNMVRLDILKKNRIDKQSLYTYLKNTSPPANE